MQISSVITDLVSRFSSSKGNKILFPRMAFSRRMRDSILFVLIFSLAHSYDISSSSIFALEWNADMQLMESIPVATNSHSGSNLHPRKGYIAVDPVPLSSSLRGEKKDWLRCAHVNTSHTSMRIHQYIIMRVNDILNPKNVVQPVHHEIEFLNKHRCKYRFGT